MLLISSLAVSSLGPPTMIGLSSLTDALTHPLSPTPSHLHSAHSIPLPSLPPTLPPPPTIPLPLTPSHSPPPDFGAHCALWGTVFLPSPPQLPTGFSVNFPGFSQFFPLETQVTTGIIPLLTRNRQDNWNTLA